MRTITVAALAAISLAASATPSAARSTRYVAYGDLDLSNPAGRSELRQRTAHAVEQVCGPVEVRDIRSGEMVEACRADTWTMVQPQLDAAFGASVELVADARIAVRKSGTARR